MISCPKDTLIANLMIQIMHYTFTPYGYPMGIWLRISPQFSGLSDEMTIHRGIVGETVKAEVPCYRHDKDPSLLKGRKYRAKAKLQPFTGNGDVHIHVLSSEIFFNRISRKLKRLFPIDCTSVVRPSVCL